MKKGISFIAWLLLVIGGLNWGLVGIFDFDLVSTIFGDMTGITRVIYALVGLAAVYTVVMPPKKG